MTCSAAQWAHCSAVSEPRRPYSQWGDAVAVVAGEPLLLLATQLHARSLDLLGAATCAFFVAMAGIATADPAPGLRHWTSAPANGTLAATALVSIAVRRPFTLSFACALVRPEFWHTPRFIRFNMVLTAIWTLAFTIAAHSCAAIVRYDHSAAVPLVTVQVLAFVLPFVLGARYAERAKSAATQALA